MSMIHHVIAADPVACWEVHDAVQSAQVAVFDILPIKVFLFRELQVLQLRQNLLIHLNRVLEDGEDCVPCKCAQNCFAIDLR